MIADLEHDGNLSKDEKEKNKCRRELKIARSARLYLEDGPTEESVTRQYDQAMRGVSRVIEEFDRVYPAGADARTKSEFMKDKGLPELKRQVKILGCIL
jgi:hypothetical protein